MRINKQYCVSCGGLRSYEEAPDVTATASVSGPRVEVYPTPYGKTATWTTSTEERICGCRVNKGKNAQ